MTLISEEYRALNRTLHAKGNYGVGGHRWAARVLALREKYACNTVLDYGCGRGTLGNALGRPEWFYEYDPAIDGKDGEPPNADLVICTDVLEHIEPDCLDAVLCHIRRKAKRIAFLNIATRPAAKKLADGRNAHLIVQDADWWLERLDADFLIEESDATAQEANFVVSRMVALGAVKTKSAVSKEIRGEQMKRNLPRVSGRIDVLQPNDLTAILCCYGPSLHRTWMMARAARERGKARLATVSGAHDFMIERGVVPDFHLECDPREHKAVYTTTPHRSVRYLLASCVHPKMINQLAGHDVYLWHVATDDHSLEVLGELDPGSPAIAGGGSIGLRALNVLYCLGFRRFEIYGMDCSFADDGEQHAGFHAGKKMRESRIRVGKRWFRSSLTMRAYADQFFQNVIQMNAQAKRDGEAPIRGEEYVAIELAGDGMLQAMAREGVREAESAA